MISIEFLYLSLFLLWTRTHIQALAQCELTLNKLGVAKVTADDTAGAAQVTFSSSFLKPDPYSALKGLHLLPKKQIVATESLRDTGAIASARAAEIYGLNILAEGIQVWV